MRSLLPLILLLLHSTAHAAADCSHAGIQRARSAADKKMKQKDYKGAVETLKGVKEECTPEPVEVDDGKPPAQETMDFYWLRSDLSDALLHAGAPVECMRLLAPLDTPRRPYGLELYGLGDSKVASAIRYNFQMCQQAHEKRFAGLSADGCIDSFCVVFDKATASIRDDDQKEEPDVGKVCPQLHLRSGKKKTFLKVKDGPLVDPSLCCNIDGFTAGKLNGRMVMRFGGGGHPCDGGTANGSVDALYEWTGSELKLLEDNAVYEH
jgi:hypothetical protein